MNRKNRELTEEEKNLWLEVNKDTIRLENQDIIKPEMRKTSNQVPFNDQLIKQEKQRSFAVESRKLPPKKSITPKQREKSISAGRFEYDAIMDLHGKTITQAYENVINFIKFCYNTEKRHVMIITGNGGKIGSIKREFCFWVEESCIKQYISSYIEAHPNQGGSGAYYIIVKRKKT